ADVRRLSVEDGLSNRFVTSIHKDNRGFMWISTRYGLNRYDGYEFKHYTKGNSTLTTNNIDYIYEDSQQQFWLVQQSNTKMVVDILNPHTGRIQNFDTLFKTLAPFKAEMIRSVYSNAKTLWITTASGKLYRYKNNRFEHVFTTSKPIRGIFFAGKDFLWMFYSRSDILQTLTGLDLKTGTSKTFEVYDRLLFTGMDATRNLWLFQPEEKIFLKVYWEKQLVEPATVLPPELPDFASSITFSEKHYLNPPDHFIWWLSGAEDFYTGFPVAWHLKEKVGYDFKEKITPLLTYGNTPVIHDAYFDTEDRLWLATQDGVFILGLKKNNFTTITATNGENYSARNIVEDLNGMVYVSNYSGGLRLHPEKGIVKRKRPGIGLTAKDGLGNIWFIGKDSRIEKYDPVSGKSRYYSYEVTSDQYLMKQWTLMSDTKGHIWIGSSQGLYILEPETVRFQEFTQYNSFIKLKDSDIYHLQETEEGIWMAASSGLYLLEPGKGITTRYSSEQVPPYYIPYDDILHFHRDSEGIFWLATKGGGLVRFDPKDGSTRQFTTEEGLSNNIIYAVYEDDYGKLWLPSNYGLMQFDKKTHRVTTYLKSDGIAHNEFNTSSHYQGSDGKLYFGGLAGVTIFHPKNFVTEDPISTPLRITRCRVLDGETGVLTDKTAAAIRGILELFPSDKSLLLEFALLNFKNTQGNSYTYMIEGLDTDWTPIRTNSLRINALPYGKYILRIKGKGIGGEQSANVLHIALRVHKPFYLKNGFILSCVVVLILLVYGIFRWRLQNLKRVKLRLQKTVRQRTREIQRQKDKLEELNTTQSRWFNNIAHELRTPLTLIHGPIQQLLKKDSPAFEEDTQTIQLAGKNTRSLLRLVNEILDVSRLDSNRLELNRTPARLSPLVRDAAAQFEAFAQQKGVTLTSHILHDPELYVDKERIRNILVNLISNALKFTHVGGNVTIALQYEAGKDVTITVADTGDGIPEKDLPHIFERYFQVSDPSRINLGGAGIGLSLALELARLHGGDLSVESHLGEGSTFTLSLPQSLVCSTSKSVTMPVVVTLPDSPNTSASSSEDRQDKPLILLVEDHPDMRQYIRGGLEKNYRMAEAGNGLEALDYLKRATPELIISDIMMPRMDGITLAKTLKEDEYLKHLPFITLTARSGEADKIAAFRIGIDDYLTKPFNPEELEARVANLIRNYRVRRTVSHTDPGEMTTPGYQNTILTALKEVVLSHLEDYTFTAEDLATSQNMSLSSLRRFLKKATGLSPGQFIREIRLQQARRLLEATQYSSVAEVMYAVGFEKASYFTRLFTERFGKNPSEYL
ncbi:MAG: ATP-binding protein, partial [Bacteroidota bacterium]